MKHTIIISIVFGIIVEGTLCILNVIFPAKFPGPEGGDVNFMGYLDMYSHLPSIYIVDIASFSSVLYTKFGISFFIFAGTIQWFMLALVCILLYKKLRRTKAA